MSFGNCVKTAKTDGFIINLKLEKGGIRNPNIKTHSKGYKNYLYFISPESVEINKQRVNERVKNRGHPVPINKIEDRYYKSLD